MEVLNEKTFTGAFEQFNQSLNEYDGSTFISFSVGVPNASESYKPVIRQIALQRLDPQKWTLGTVGTGKILEALISSIEIRESDEIRNNLVSWEPKGYGPGATAELREKLVGTSALQAFERAIFDLFHGTRDPEQVFELLIEHIGRRYDLIAYVFFIFDDKKYLPIAPRTFDEAFELIGLSTRMSMKCSWSNYMSFVQGVGVVQAALRDWAGVENPSLIDAHSFLWILVRLPRENAMRARQGLKRPGALKYAMIELGQRIVSRVSQANGQLEARTVKNKELFGFTSNEALYNHLELLWSKQNGRCKLTGLPMLLPQKALPITELVASPDRIDSDGPYSPDNMQLTCWFANRWKGTQSDEAFSRLLDIVRRGEASSDEHPHYFGQHNS